MIEAKPEETSMRVKIDVECTPAEARAFLGLPDVEPLQKAAMKDMEERVRAAIAATAPEALMKAWLPGGQGTWEQAQKAFWSQFGGAKKGEGA
jgi:hypothetical protein